MIMLVIEPKRIRVVLPEGLLVADDVGVSNGGQYADFIERVFLLLVIEGYEFHSLQSVLLVVANPPYFVH